MMRFLLLISLFTLSYFNAFSQQPLFLSLELGPKGDIYQLNDPAGQLSTGPVFSYPNLAINLNCRMTDRFDISGGLLFNAYSESFRLKDQVNLLNSTSTIMSTISIPLRLHTRIFPWKTPDSRVSIGATIGYHIVFNLDYQSFTTTRSGSFGFNQEIILETNTSNEKTEIFGLLEAGLFVDLNLAPRWILTFSTHYTYGFEDILETNIFYSTDGGFSFQSATATSEGRYYDFHVGVKYRLTKMD